MSFLRRFVWIFVIVFSIVVIWAFARQYHLIRAQKINSWTEDQIADCGVVLTGGPNRIREGIDLLGRGSIQKLIISGVHPQAELRDIYPMWPYMGDLKESDVILEKRSRTTYGNAQQSLPLVEALHCRDVILITSQMHMYRARRTFMAEWPQNVQLLTRAVSSGPAEASWSEVAIEVIKGLFYWFWAY